MNSTRTESSFNEGSTVNAIDNYLARRKTRRRVLPTIVVVALIVSAGGLVAAINANVKGARHSTEPAKTSPTLPRYPNGPDTTSESPQHTIQLRTVIVARSRDDILIDGQSIPFEEVQKTLQRQAEYLRLAGGTVDDVTVVIRASSQASTGVIQDVVQKCQHVGFCNFQFAVLDDDR